MRALRICPECRELFWATDERMTVCRLDGDPIPEPDVSGEADRG